MFFRLLIIVLLGVVIYRVLKSVLGGAQVGRRGTTYDPTDRVDDVMVKDPVCGIYFPKRDGVRVDGRHEVFYFCSNECRDRYLAQQSKRS